MAKNSFTDWDTTANNNTDVAGVNIAEGCAPSGINNAIRAIMAQLKSGVDGKVVYAAKASGYTAAATDNGAYHRATAGITVGLTAAATLGNGWHLFIQANGGNVVIDPNGAETVNGASTVTILDGQSALLICTGSTFFAYIIPGLAAANAWTGAQSYSNGISFGATAVASVTDFSKHINLYNSVYGWTVTGGSLNHVSGINHNFYSGSTLVATIASTGNFTPVGDVTLASNKAITFSGTGAATTRTNLGVAPFVSSQQTITLGSSVTVAHGLSATPSNVTVDLVCTTANLGYSINDVVQYSAFALNISGTGYVGGVGIEKNATNVIIRYPATLIGVWDKTANNGTISAITVGSWRVVVRAYL